MMRWGMCRLIGWTIRRLELTEEAPWSLLFGVRCVLRVALCFNIIDSLEACWQVSSEHIVRIYSR